MKSSMWTWKMNKPTTARAQIMARLVEIEEDPRYQAGRKHPANVVINAPLALIQLSLEVGRITLRKVLTVLAQEKQ